MFGLGIDIGIGDAGNATPASYFGSALILATDSEHLTVVTGNVTAATDFSGAGHNLVGSGATFTASGGAHNLPFVTLAVNGSLSSASRIISAGADRTTYHVFKATSSTVDLVGFSAGAAPAWILQYSSGINTNSDESTFNNTGSYTFDTTNVHVLESQYHVGSVAPYIIDGVTTTQTGAHVAISDSGAGTAFSIGAAVQAASYIWYATYVVNKLTSAQDDAFMSAYLNGKYK